jgi:hypothetical protein
VSTIDVDVFTDNEGRYAVVARYDGIWPSSIFKCYEDGTEDYEDIDFVDELAPHLADGEVAVLMTAGAENLRYVTGYAIALKNDGSTMTLDINNIYDNVLHAWGINPSRAEY